MPRRRPVFRAAYARGLAALLGVAMLAGVFVPPAAAKPYGGGLNCEGIMGVSCVVAPTGLSNDSVPIQAAINAASQATNASNAEVYLPAGTYNIGSTVTVSASVQLRGAGAATLLQPTSALSGPALSTTANSVTIANLAVAGNQGVATSSTDCIQATGGTDLAISNVAVSNCKRDGIRLSGVTRANLAGVTASTNQANGIDVLGASSYVSIVNPTVFDNNKASGTGGVAVAGTSVATNIANLVAYDDQGGSATQLYPLAEGGTADYTVIQNLYASGNVTSNTPSLAGAHSQNGGTTFSQPTISGACPTTAGTLGFATSLLCVGDGSASHNVVTADQTQTLTNKTLTSPTLGGTVAGAPTWGSGQSFPTLAVSAGTSTVTATGNATSAAAGFGSILPMRLTRTTGATMYTGVSFSGINAYDTALYVKPNDDHLYIGTDAGVSVTDQVAVGNDGMLIGAPTGAGTGAGTLNTAGAIYANGTQAITSGGKPVLSTASNSLAADVALNNTALYRDGPSMAQGTSGTWCASGTVTAQDTAGAANFFATLWDGTTVIATTEQNATAVNQRMALAVSGCLASPTGNIRISVKDASSTSGSILSNVGGSTKDSTITGWRVG